MSAAGNNVRSSSRAAHWIWIALGALTAVLFATDLAVGAQNLPLREVWRALCGFEEGVVTDIVLSWRLPKALVAMAAGAGLAVCGLQMQTLFRNPLAGPYVLGVSSGASLGVAFFLMGMPLLGGAQGFVRDLGAVGAAWVGGAAVMSLVMAVAARLKDIMAVLILGIMLGSAASALVEVMQFWGTEASVKSFAVWTMGALGHVTAHQLWILLPVVGAGLVLSFGLIKSLNILLLGENYARSMGMRVAWMRAAVCAATVLLAGTLTAFCGPIGFLGIAVPHLARMLFATADHRVLMPASALVGAALMLICDLISSRFTLPVNTVTALLGIPVVILVIVRNKRMF